jgi:hypothetical protein
MHNALDVLAAAEPQREDTWTWLTFLDTLPAKTSVTVSGRKYELEKTVNSLHVTCNSTDVVTTFVIMNGNLVMLSHGNYVTSSNVHEVLRKYKTKEELLRYLIGRAHNHCATAAAEPGVSYDIDEVIDTLQNHPKERFIGHDVTIFLDEKGSVAFVTSKQGAGLGYVERGVGGKIKLRLNNTSETVAGRVTSMEHLASCILAFAERVSGKAHAAAEPQAIPTGPRTPNQAHADLLEFLNARNKFTIPNVRGYRVTVGSYNTVCPVIHVWKPEWARFGYEITCIVDQHRSSRGTYPKLYKVIDPRSTVVSGNFELVSGDIHTGVTSWKDLLRKAIALMIRRGESDVKKLAAEQKRATKVQGADMENAITLLESVLAAAEPRTGADRGSMRTYTPEQLAALWFSTSHTTDLLEHFKAKVTGFEIKCDGIEDDGSVPFAVYRGEIDDAEENLVGYISFYPGTLDLGGKDIVAEVLDDGRDAKLKLKGKNLAAVVARVTSTDVTRSIAQFMVAMLPHFKKALKL